MVNLVGEGRNGAVFIAACSDVRSAQRYSSRETAGRFEVQHKVSEQYYACKVLHKALASVESSFDF